MENLKLFNYDDIRKVQCTSSVDVVNEALEKGWTLLGMMTSARDAIFIIGFRHPYNLEEAEKVGR